MKCCELSTQLIHHQFNSKLRLKWFVCVCVCLYVVHKLLLLPDCLPKGLTAACLASVCPRPGDCMTIFMTSCQSQKLQKLKKAWIRIELLDCEFHSSLRCVFACGVWRFEGEDFALWPEHYPKKNASTHEWLVETEKQKPSWLSRLCCWHQNVVHRPNHSVNTVTQFSSCGCHNSTMTVTIPSHCLWQLHCDCHNSSVAATLPLPWLLEFLCGCHNSTNDCHNSFVDATMLFCDCYNPTVAVTTPLWLSQFLLIDFHNSTVAVTIPVWLLQFLCYITTPLWLLQSFLCDNHNSPSPKRSRDCDNSSLTVAMQLFLCYNVTIPTPWLSQLLSPCHSSFPSDCSLPVTFPSPQWTLAAAVREWGEFE